MYLRNGSQTCHLSVSPLREPGVAGSSPCTLNTSLDIPILCSSSSNGPTTNTVDHQGQSPGGSVSGQVCVWAGGRCGFQFGAMIPFLTIIRLVPLNEEQKVSTRWVTLLVTECTKWIHGLTI